MTLNIQNDTDEELPLCIEPWAGEHPIPPGTTYTLDVIGAPHIAGPTLIVTRRGITIYPEAEGFALRDDDTVIDEAQLQLRIANRQDFLDHLDDFASRHALEVFAVSRRHLLAAMDEIGFDHFDSSVGIVLGWIAKALQHRDSEDALWSLVCIDLCFGMHVGGRHWDELVGRDPANVRYAIETSYWQYTLWGIGGGYFLAPILNRHQCWDAADAYVSQQDEAGLRDWWRRRLLPSREPGST